VDPDKERACMVDHQLRRRGIADSRVLSAMGEVPREAFVANARQKDAYLDAALPLSHGQTISQPLMVAMSIEALRLEGDETVLEVGAGSGYQAAVLSKLAKKVVALSLPPARGGCLARSESTMWRSFAQMGARGGPQTLPMTASWWLPLPKRFRRL